MNSLYGPVDALALSLFATVCDSAPNTGPFYPHCCCGESGWTANSSGLAHLDSFRYLGLLLGQLPPWPKVSF
jgi:hypothetical protein